MRLNERWVLLIFCIFCLGVFGLVIYRYIPQLRDGEQASYTQGFTIGVMVPLSGSSASYGFSIRKGIELAREHSPDGAVKLRYVDTMCDPELARSAMEKFVEQGIRAVIGEACSGATLVAAQVAMDHGIVLVSPASTSPALSDIGGTYVYRTVPPDTAQGVYTAQIIRDRGIASVGIAFSDEPYGSALMEVFSESYEALGGRIAFSVPLDAHTVSGSTISEALTVHEPQAVYIVSNVPTLAASVINTIRESGFTGELFGSESLNDSHLIAELGTAADGLIITSVSHGDMSFIRAYRQLYGQPPDVFAAQGYDAFVAITRAQRMAESGGTDLPSAMKKLDEPGAAGPIRFDEHGNVPAAYSTVVIQNEQFSVTTH